MNRVLKAGPIAVLTGSHAAVTFTKEYQPQSQKQEVIEFNNELKIAPWGEDNIFPQRIASLMAYYAIGPAALDLKARMLQGQGIIPGKIIDIDPKLGKIIEPLDRAKFPEVYRFIESPWHHRFQAEYFLDHAWFNNCFPEMILNNKGDKIAKFKHQQSSNCRFKQMDNHGKKTSVYISNFWADIESQLGKFDPTAKTRTAKAVRTNFTAFAKEFVTEVPCIDMYDPVHSLTQIAASLKSKKFKSAILPTNYPSINRPYYQVPSWDASRLAGWIEIAIKIPSMVKLLYKKAFKIKYHIEIPENSYFEKKFGIEEWHSMSIADKESAKDAVLQSMDQFLEGDEASINSFVSYFDVDKVKGEEVGRIKITPVEDKSSINQEILSGSAADTQFLISANLPVDSIGAGRIGTGQQRSGGSNARENFLIYNSLMLPERNVLLAPWYLVRDFNGWDPDIHFFIQDTVLKTLDSGSGTEKVVS